MTNKPRRLGAFRLVNLVSGTPEQRDAKVRSFLNARTPEQNAARYSDWLRLFAGTIAAIVRWATMRSRTE